jgi:hypothetical protein
MPTGGLSSSSSSAAHGTSTSGFDNSGFVVNFGSGALVPTTTPTWIVVAAIIGAVWLLHRKR